MATTYLIKLETVQFDDLDCNIPIQETIPIQQSDGGQYLKTLNSNECQAIDIAGYVNTNHYIYDNKSYTYQPNNIQIVQLENPLDIQNSMETMSDTSCSTNTTELNNPAASSCDKIKAHQRKLNKYVRIRFRETFGKEFLMTHDLHECDQEKFDALRKEAMALFKPPGVSERSAWARAKQSLRLMRNAMLK